MNQILVLSEDENPDGLADRLSRCGFHTALCATTEFEAARMSVVDLVILEVGNGDPIPVLTIDKIRAASTVPILVHSEGDNVTSCVVTLEHGADDYVLSTVPELELLARIKALLRRSTMVASAQDLLVADDLSLHVNARRLVRSDKNVDLTPHEFDILRILLESAGRLVSRREISKEVFRSTLSRNRAIDVHMSSLRKKLGPRPDGSGRIRTIRGHGYIYERE